jgi:hypothetical protein
MIVYCYDENMEFTESKDVDSVVAPENSTRVQALDRMEGFAVIYSRDLKGWNYVHDNRGVNVYSKTKKERFTIDKTGPIGSGYTKLRPNPFDDWDGEKWVENKSYRADHLRSKLMSYIDTAHNNIYNRVLGYKNTAFMRERYISKYNRAKNGDPAYTEEERGQIIAAHEHAESIVNYYIDAIEPVRSLCGKIIDAGLLDESVQMMIEGKSISFSATETDIKNFFKKWAVLLA